MHRHAPPCSPLKITHTCMHTTCAHESDVITACTGKFARMYACTHVDAHSEDDFLHWSYTEIITKQTCRNRFTEIAACLK